MEVKPRANDSDSDDMTSDSVYEVARTNEQLKEYRYGHSRDLMLENAAYTSARGCVINARTA